MIAGEMRFLADESCDFAVVRSLRSAGYNVVAVSESLPSAPDIKILRAAVEDNRILITEDSDFGEWIFAHKEKMNGGNIHSFPWKCSFKAGRNVP
jgi:predicted nuclease of predicted toxin-antitoxin system